MSEARFLGIEERRRRAELKRANRRTRTLAMIATGVTVAVYFPGGHGHEHRRPEHAHKSPFHEVHRKAEPEMRTAKIVYSNLRADIDYDGLTPSPYLSAGYVRRVMGQAIWVSDKLRIPEKFVMADWFMEMGKGSTLSNANILDNNLCNAGEETANGFVLIRYPTLQAFSRNYVETLRSAHVPPTNNMATIVSDMKNEGFFGAESTQSYLAKVEGVIPIVSGKPYNPAK